LIRLVKASKFATYSKIHFTHARDLPPMVVVDSSLTPEKANKQ